MISQLARLREFRPGDDVDQFLSTHYRQNNKAIQDALNNLPKNQLVLANFAGYGTSLNINNSIARFQGATSSDGSSMTLVQSDDLGDKIVFNDRGQYSVNLIYQSTGGDTLVMNGDDLLISSNIMTNIITLGATFWAEATDELTLQNTIGSLFDSLLMRLVKLA